MTRRNVLRKKGPLSLRDLSLECSKTLDKGVETYQSINRLCEMTETVHGEKSCEISSALDEMESVIVHLASAASGGDLDGSRTELESRGVTGVL